MTFPTLKRLTTRSPRIASSTERDPDRLTDTELIASRARVVRGADQLRRDIERNLHDTTEQRLVSLALHVQGLKTMVEPTQIELTAELDNVAHRLGETLEELQDIVRGLHPPILSAVGLAPALRALAQRTVMPVELSIALPQRLPASLEANAYYIVSEALDNATKHAAASVTQINLNADATELTLSIHDNGIGGADPTRGSGLVALRDRVEGNGGTLDLSSPAGHGTSLTILLPIDR